MPARKGRSVMSAVERMMGKGSCYKGRAERAILSDEEG